MAADASRSASPSVGVAASFSESRGARSSGRAIAGVALRWALSSSRTAFHLPKVVEPVRMSTATSRAAPLTKVGSSDGPVPLRGQCLARLVEFHHPVGRGAQLQGMQAALAQIAMIWVNDLTICAYARQVGNSIREYPAAVHVVLVGQRRVERVRSWALSPVVTRSGCSMKWPCYLMPI